MYAAVALLCLPIGGQAGRAIAKCAEAVPLPALADATQPSWLGPHALAISSACLLVLALTLALRYQPPDWSVR